MNHYEYLKENLNNIFHKIGIQGSKTGMIAAHGDKAYGYEDEWNKAGVPFNHGVVVYFLTYLKPWSETVRETKNGWIAPGPWVIKTYFELKEKFGEDIFP